MKIFAKLALIVLVSVAAQSGAQAETAPTVITPKNIVWQDDTEPGAPKGLKIAVLDGDPSKAEPYVILAKFPAHSSFPLHTYPKAENVTVLRGTFGVAFGTTDKSKGQLLACR